MANTLRAWFGRLFKRQPPPVCRWCERGFPVGAFGYRDKHAITGWDDEVRFEPCATPGTAIQYEDWEKLRASSSESGPVTETPR